MQLMKIIFVCGLLVLAMAMSGVAQIDSTRSEGIIVTIQPDLLKAPSWHPQPDTIRTPAKCIPQMPTMKFSGPKPAKMPNMPIDEELTSNMPILGQDSSCIENELPGE